MAKTGGRKEHYTVIAPGTEDALEQPMLLSEHSFVTDSQGRYVSQLGPALEFPEDRIQDLAPFGSLDYRYSRTQIERELARYNGGVLDPYDKESLDEGAKQSPRKITVIRPSRRKTTPKRNKQKK